MDFRKSGLIVGLFCTVSAASAQITTTSSVVGFLKVDKPAGELNLLGNNFEDTTLSVFAPADRFNGDIAAGNADTMYIWNTNSGGYQVYSVYDERSYLGPTGAVEWRDFNDFSGASVDPDIPAGSALWLFSVGSVTDTNLTIYGNVIDTQVSTNKVVAGLQQLSYPFSVTVDLNDTLLANVATGDIAAGNADTIYAWNVETQTYAVYALYDERPYLGPSGTVEWRNFNEFGSPAGSANINLGQGFWYDANAGFEWVETNKYYNSL